LKQWYEQSFGKDYLLIYNHRKRQDAAEEIAKMIVWLNLPSQSKVLDLCCGTGRHAIALADAGYRVTGVDLSAELLQEARAADMDNRIRWIESDMRNLPFKESTERFDAVLNLFTSIGYFEEDSEHLKVLEQVRLALKPEGRFIIDYLNVRHTIDRLVPRSEKIIEGNVITETRQVQAGFVMKSIVIQKTGRPLRYYKERVKLYTLEAFSEMLAQSGLFIDAVYGNYDGSTYDEQQSPRMIMVGHRDIDR
jgi:SAM-dependent methyltransferase